MIIQVYYRRFKVAYFFVPRLCHFRAETTERKGFEPLQPFGWPDFKSGAIDHSATSPGASRLKS